VVSDIQSLVFLARGGILEDIMFLGFVKLTLALGWSSCLVPPEG
jgi:hypothetical protein